MFLRYEHCLHNGLAAYRQSDSKRRYCFGYVQNLAHAQIDAAQFQYALQFLVNFIRNKANAHMGLNALRREMKHWPHIQRPFGYPIRPFYNPQIAVLLVDFLCRKAGICQVAF